ncbi:sporulation protein [Thermopolyspora sp. NPDC052614]|uniref:sporulation protein n=1 Tax=Thermopolyspora sp. NPDC052614 TaxID=3155682 RepID=UPI0034443C2B
MVFKRLLGAFGVGAPSVDTVLATPGVRPGETMRGEVRLKGGDFDADIEYIALGLVTRVEAEHGEGEQTGLMEFYRTEVSGPFRLGTGEERVLPFEFPVPWETPVTEVWNEPLHGMAMGVRTELAIAKAVDKGDLDAIRVNPLPSQDVVLQAFARLGFQFKGADLEVGSLYGVDQHLPFYQEIEFYPPPAYAHVVNEIELTFVASPAGLDIVLEADARGGHSGYSGDSFGRWRASHEEALHRDWAAEINGWLTALAQHGGHGGYGGHHDPYDHDSHHGGHDLGTVAAAGAAGVVGGMIAAEVIDEIGDMFEGEEEEED